jgi:oxepin-CoA hydrolase / 3-oxo-5,6-dehydrosuberyl-CoA semialdehyde dehydrogenase
MIFSKKPSIYLGGFFCLRTTACSILKHTYHQILQFHLFSLLLLCLIEEIPTIQIHQTMNYTNNYILGHWENPKGEMFEQLNAITGEQIALAGSDELDYEAIVAYAKKKGGTALRKMTFFERGMMLKTLALYLIDRKARYYKPSYWTGATLIDNKIDVDGGIGTLFAYASLRKKFGNQSFYVDGEQAKISANGTFIGQHIMVPKTGVAIHINAFNFPIWGMLEKIAVNLLAGMPAIVKASEITSYVTEEMIKDIIKTKILPEGALQFIGGKGHGILNYLSPQDVVTFTGSASTGKMLKTLPQIIQNSVPFNMEADSLNAIVLGNDIEPNMPEWDIFIKEIRKEVVTKTGQKCTAIRRVIVPARMLDEVQKSLSKELYKTTIGNPQTEGVRMGAIVSRPQLEKVKEQLAKLAKNTPIVHGDTEHFQVVNASKNKGAFISPIILRNDHPFKLTDTHDTEAFGPICTIMPYDDIQDAVSLVNMGKGSLVSTICTMSSSIAKDYVIGCAPFHGRILILNRESAPENTGHGSPMPQLYHGGPGRAGGGGEMGGTRGVTHYLQTTALQGHPTMISEITQTYQYGGAYTEKEVHVFRKHYEELEIGDTIITHKHTITEADITNFANVSGDNFYAHMDATSLEGTPFEKRVAHGYFILSKAAGLFVDPKKGPVLLNYGIEEARFTKPVYPGSTIGVRFTCKEKLEVEQKEEDTLPPRGIVKWLVDVYDETGETVALATILTMVKKVPS